MRKGLIFWLGVYGLFSGALIAKPAPQSKNEFTITTLNIKWYGNNAGERRDSSLKSFIQKNLADSDGILFQEIVDVQRLFERVMGENEYNCYNYAHNNRGHQSVVLCLKKEFTLSIEADDDNWKVDDVSYGSNGARPALSGVVKDSKGTKLFHMLGVHLKAFPKKTNVRLSQTKSLAERIETYPDQLPVVLLGDFNSHIKTKTQKSRDDKYLMLDILGEVGMELVDLEEQNTWVSRSKRSQLDQVYISNDITLTDRPRVDGACNLEPNDQSAGLVQQYLSTISDHCPITVNLEF